MHSISKIFSLFDFSSYIRRYIPFSYSILHIFFYFTILFLYCFVLSLIPYINHTLIHSIHHRHPSMCSIFCILKHEFTKAGLLRAANRTARYILQYFELYYSHETSSTCFVPRPLSLLYFACTHVYNLYFLVCSCVRVCVFLVVYYTESARFGPYSKRSH